MADATQPPLVLTLALEPAAAARFEALRQQHFPAARNQVPAHLSLFHALPGEREAAILDGLQQAARRPRMQLRVTGLMPLGRGVAFRVEPGELRAIHSSLQQHWEPWLTAQDRQRLHPHITVQNKATAEEAKALLAQLSAAFAPFTITATGLTLWDYLGGPWAHRATVPFLEA